MITTRDEIRRMLDECREAALSTRKALVGDVLERYGGELTAADLEDLADYILREDTRGGLRGQHARGVDKPFYTMSHEKNTRRNRRARGRGDVGYVDELGK